MADKYHRLSKVEYGSDVIADLLKATGHTKDKALTSIQA